MPAAFFLLLFRREDLKCRNENPIDEGSKMKRIYSKPTVITSDFFRLGTSAFPSFLSLGKVGMIIEGGTGPTFPIIVDQIKELGIEMDRIEYVLLTHTHADHIGAVPHLKRKWPHVKLVASAPAARILNTSELYNEFLLVDLGIAQLMKAKGEIGGMPSVPEDFRFEVDLVVKGGDTIELGNGVVWEIIDTPGHSVCHISAYEKKEATLVVGDATGFYVPEKDLFWPNYFVSLVSYLDSIRKLSSFPAKRAVLSHNAVIESDVYRYFEKAMEATREYHKDTVSRLGRGDSAESIALERAHFVSTLTDIQPFKVMYDLCKLMIHRSQVNGVASSFFLFENPERSLPGPAISDPEESEKAFSNVGAIMLPTKKMPLSLNDRLSLMALIDEGMRRGLAEAPVSADLFNDLWELVGATAKGGRINRLKFEDSKNGFQMFEVKAESGENLARLNMIYLRKPIPCYYLVYVEVAAPFRRKGLGNLILKAFGDFLTDKSAVGILDNIIPLEDPTNDIYLKHSWIPVGEIIGNQMFYKENNYMLFIPPAFKDKDLKQPILRLMVHLKRKRAVIDIRENENMVRKTLSEFRELYQVLLTYFGQELETPHSSLFMRFMFTRFVTKFIAFRRRIGDLVGYTGGESTEQIVLEPRIKKLQVKTYAPRELLNDQATCMGDLGLLSLLPEELKRKPAQTIERLPNYRRPNFLSWLKEHGKSYEDTLTLGDLMDLGFDPTRLKEITLDNQEYIFERVQARQIESLQKRGELLKRISLSMPNVKVKGAQLRINPILLIIGDRGNGYVLRRKIDAIHWEEAIEQLQSNRNLKTLNQTARLDRIILSTVQDSATAIAKQMGLPRESVIDQLTPFVSWDLKNNQPKVVVDFSFSYLATLWVA